MANLPPYFPMVPSFAAPGAPIAAPAVTKDQNMVTAEQLVLELCNPELREKALHDLSKKREIFQDLAPLLWHSFGTITALLQEIVSIYPSLSPPTLSSDQSNRVCNALALLQIPLYLYPFLNTLHKEKQYEYLRLTSLGVIGALVKVDDPEIIAFLLVSEIIPLCLRTMEIGSELSKTVATFIIQKIVLDNSGLAYVCATSDRCRAVVCVLALMIELTQPPSPRLLKHIIRCCLRLTDHPRACDMLRVFLPISLTNGILDEYIQDDVTMRWLRQVVHNLNISSRGPHAGLDHMMGA